MFSVFKAIKFIGIGFIILGLVLTIVSLWHGRNPGVVFAMLMIAVWGVILYLWGWTKTWIG